MSKKPVMILILLSAILLFSCTKENIIINEENISEPKVDEVVEIASDEESKPLIVVSPTDVVEIVVRADGAPGMYLGDDNEVHGFYVDLEKMVMKEMGQSFHFYPYSDLGPVLHGLKTGIYHIALAVPDVPDYRALFNLSLPYEILHFVTFVRNDNNDIQGATKEEIIKTLYGRKVGVQTQGHIYQALREYKEIELVEYETTTSALEALNKGLLDAVPDVKRIGNYYRKLNNWDIKSVGDPIISQKITTSFSLALDPSLRDRYNIALKSVIDDGRLKTLWESYFGPMSREDIP
jgi:ABC-type amino acid transport substrate-binding protein